MSSSSFTPAKSGGIFPPEPLGRYQRMSRRSIRTVVFLVLCTVVALFLILFSRSTPGSVPSFIGGSALHRPVNDRYDKVFVEGCADPQVDASKPRAKAAIVMLTRNEDIDGVVDSLRSYERHFNRWFHYPYIFLNDKHFSKEFKDEVARHISAPAKFGLVKPEHWEFPSSINQNDIAEAVAEQGRQGIMYGSLESYHRMCRFYSGQFYKHELLADLDWYWRLEPDVKFYCDITYDPFLHMEANNKVYGWTIAIKELPQTVPNLFRYVQAYRKKNKLESKGMWEMFIETEKDLKTTSWNGKSVPAEQSTASLLGTPSNFEVGNDFIEGERYNMCHFWSNFEIAKLSWYRSKEYADFFQTLENAQGFWKERWGDAPVHSLAVGALLSTSQVHHFRDVGYRHTTIAHCPANAPGKQLPADPYKEPMLTYRTEASASDKDQAAADQQYWSNPDSPQTFGTGCRCRCDTDTKPVEIRPGSCYPHWVNVLGGWASL